MQHTGNKNIGRIESFSVFFVAMFLCGLLFFFYKTVMPYQYGDTAFLLEVVSNLANGAPATSSILAQNAAEIALARAELGIYCTQGLVAAQFSSDPYNVFSLHAYLILYLIAPLARIFGALNTLSAVTALSFTSIPCIAYVYLRNSGVFFWVSLMASIAVIIHPAWRISSGGQFYVDRFFIPMALLYAVTLHRYFMFNPEETDVPKTLLFWVILIGVIGGLTSERNAIILSAYSFSYALIVRAQLNRKVYSIAFSILCACFALIYMHYFGGTPDNARVQKSLFHLPEMINALTRPGLGEYLLFNFSFLVFPAVFAPRVFFAVIPIVAINCFITIGGAEKNGWLTHYHSHYYGFLLAAFLIALANSTGKFHDAISTFLKKSIKPLMLCFTLFILISFEYYYKNTDIFLSLWDFYGRPFALSASRTHKDMFDNLSSLVPAGITVTATEWGMAAWYLRGNKVNIFPIGVGTNNYIMVQAEGEIPNIKLFSAVRYKADALRANECFSSIISKDYEKLSQQGTWVLFKKKNQERIP